jgi:hypothetical protein
MLFDGRPSAAQQPGMIDLDAPVHDEQKAGGTCPIASSGVANTELQPYRREPQSLAGGDGVVDGGAGVPAVAKNVNDVDRRLNIGERGGYRFA